MYFRIIGNYLVEEGVLTRQQLDSMMDYRLRNRVKLGVLAVEENLMTAEQAEEVNRLQAQMDKRFGDIAISRGYLTEENLEYLISKQGNPYILFLQGVTELGYIQKEELLLHMEQFRKKNCLSDEDMVVIRDGAAGDIAAVLLKCDDKHADAVIKLAIRNIVRFISGDVWFGQVEKITEFKTNHVAYQTVAGDDEFAFGFGCENEELLNIASEYAKEDFEQLSADAYDAICEFINCVFGLYVRDYSIEGKELELFPPAFTDNYECSGFTYVLPVRINDEDISIFVKYN